MVALRRSSLALLVGLVLHVGCSTPPSQLAALQGQNRALTQQLQDQAARLESLQVHDRNVQDQLVRAEEDLALAQERQQLDAKQVASYEQERDLVHHQVSRLVTRRTPLPAELGTRLSEISRRYPSLHFDADSGISKLDTDILFDTGSAELKPGAEEVLRELARVLAAPEAHDLKIMVAGHTDDRQVARLPARDKYANNFQLSTDRALVVAEQLRRHGVPEQRMAVAGFGPHQPIAPNVTPEDRQKNRRVELFVLAPDVPVIGWTETTPSLY